MKINVLLCVFEQTVLVKGIELDTMRRFNLDSFPTRDELEWSGEQLKAIRQRIGLSQEQFSRRVGVSRNTIVLWELEKVKPSPLAWKSLSGIINSLQNHRRDMEILTRLQER